VSGLGLVGLPVNFTADAGTLSSGTSTTDSNGVAHVTLTTTRKSTVTANVAGKTATVVVDLNPRTGISVTPPTTQVSAQQAAVFTVNVATGANIRNVSINWGDGTTTNLGAISASTPVQHTYDTDGTFTVTATATDASGFSESTSTVIRVQPAQPPGVTLIASNATPRPGQIITFTATVTGNTSAIQSFDWDFGDGTTARTTSPQITKSYATLGTKVIRVTVNQASGPSGQTQITVEVQQ
jgi:PKD repeat protein